MSKANPRILFLVPYPIGVAAGQRFRFEHYLSLLEERSIDFRCEPFWDLNAWRALYRPGQFVTKMLGILKGSIRRTWLLKDLHRYDIIYIYREMAPVGPPLFEWLVTRLFRKRTVYDFDDAIWLRNVTEENRIAGTLKWYAKARKICAWVDRVTVGNEFLAEFARRYNRDVMVVPTVVNTDAYHNELKQHDGGASVVGWTGTHSTLAYLQPIVPVLEQLAAQIPFEFVVIADRQPDFAAGLVRFIPWNKETEIEDLLRFDIGLMPLTDSEWSRGKCGFKILQYWALGIPVLASPVGVNVDMIDNGRDGFLCRNSQEWSESLERLLGDPELRRTMGLAGRQKVIERYSVAANSERFLSSLSGNFVGDRYVNSHA